MVWSLHEEEHGQEVQKDPTNPVGHLVRAWRPEVPVDDDDRDHDGENVHDEGEEEELRDERDRDGSWRQNL